jgi:uncharacterized coiled-coil protein SlyX
MDLNARILQLEEEQAQQRATAEQQAELIEQSQQAENLAQSNVQRMESTMAKVFCVAIGS